MIIPLIVLILCTIILYTFVAHIITLWLTVTCFWGSVMYRKLDQQKVDGNYRFSLSRSLLFGAVWAVPGMLWSVIKLATLP